LLLSWQGALEKRRHELKLLIDAAGQSAFGAAMGTLAYRGEYQTNGEELALVESTARAKNCRTATNWGSSGVIR
jgi:hypothetical protein